MNRALSPGSLMSGSLVDIGTTWSDYDGDDIYGDFTVSGTTVTNTDAYEPGLWRRVNSQARYQHGDHLGTLRLTSTSGGTGSSIRTFSAFGERIAGVNDRFGYVGAWGYQSTPIPESLTPDPFPYLHVGARYYDPSSGRFLQRDRIGIAGEPNVYVYTLNIPTVFIDTDGFSTNNPGGASGNTPGGARQVIEIVKDMGKMAGDGAKSYQKYLKRKDELSRAKDLLKSLKEALRDASGKKSRERITDSIKEWEKSIKGHEKAMKQLWPELTCGK